MAEAAVIFDRVSKKFTKGERFTSLRDLVPAMAGALFGRKRDDSDHLETQEFWALRDVSFEVRSGEALGIIGPNGAGKSTALKVLTRILKPDQGRSIVKGRVGSLVEIAAGFHADLSGRENVYMQGAIMGMKRAEIAKKFDDIVDFAGVGEFIDTPVKRYSSGMNARLGFAVAAHLDPDVLIIDEVLSVGDLAFQEKCYERMQLFARSGVIIVFVSHNLSAISSLCQRVLVLRNGLVETLTTTHEALTVYAKLSSDTRARHHGQELAIQLIDSSGTLCSALNSGEELSVRATAPALPAGQLFDTELLIKHLETGNIIYRCQSSTIGVRPIAVDGDDLLVEWQLTANLGRGHYAVHLIVLDARHQWVRWSQPALLSMTERQTEQAVVYLNPRCSTKAASGRTLSEGIESMVGSVADTSG